MNDRTEEIRKVLDITGVWPRLDPYIVWGLLTEFRDYGGGNPVEWYTVAIDASTVPGHARSLHSSPPSTYIPITTFTVPVDISTALVSLPVLKFLVHAGARVELGNPVVPTGGGFAFQPYFRGGVAVCVVDDFIAFAHPSFQRGMNSKFVAIWSQDAERPAAVNPGRWQAKSQLPYGFELTEMSQDAYPIVFRRAGHGTAVTYLAAANGPEFNSEADAPLLGVHLPFATVLDTSGGSMNVQVIDAVAYALASCVSDTRIVINLSYATMAGPHDGTSILECALDRLIDAYGGRLAVVVPAGNAFSQRAHAQFTLCKGNEAQTLHWFVPPALRRPSFLEVWLPDVEQGFDLELHAPDGSVHLKTTGAPQIVADGIDAVGTRCSIIRLPRVANGLNGTMLLIALAPTAGVDGKGVLSPAGVWNLSFSLHAGTATVGPVRAWIERGDSLPDFPNLGTQSYFVDPAYEDEGKTPKDPDDSCSVVQRRGAFNTVACGEHTIVAGGYRGLYTPQVRQYAKGTGSGPLRTVRRDGPDFNACTEESLALPSLRVAGNQPGDAVRGNGTSLAAPQLTRLIAELMRGGTQTPAQIRTALACLTVPNDPPVPPDCEREGLGRLPSVLDSGPVTFSKPYP